MLKDNSLRKNGRSSPEGVVLKRAWATEVPPVCGGWHRPWNRISQNFILKTRKRNFIKVHNGEIQVIVHAFDDVYPSKARFEEGIRKSHLISGDFKHDKFI